ncbi:MAG TPA: hypothetical protein VFH81_04370, partial [Actinomycetota bacterium]|nr:hypothetical protein [Actinomycetota bacterium]
MSGPSDPSDGPRRGGARGPDGPEPVGSAAVAIGLRESQRAALSASLGVLLGTILAELARRARGGGI